MSQIRPTQGVQQRRPPLPDPGHLIMIRTLPCVISLRTRGIEPAHVRFASAEFNKPETGMQVKPSDKWTMPLCPRWHRTGRKSQHSGSERKFWRDHDINVLLVCEELYAVTGDYDAMKAIILKAHQGYFPWVNN